MSSYIDLILIIFLIYSLYQGYQTGFIVSLSRLLFVIFGVLFSLFLSIKLKFLIYPGLIGSPYLAIAILALVFTAIFRKLIKKVTIFTKSFLGKTDLLWIDPILGAALGLLKAYFIVFILISIIGSFNNKTIMTPIFNSKIAFHMYSQIRQLTGFNLMKYLHNLSVKDTAEKVGKTVEQTIETIKNS